jgi:predicted TPR repeat methyltransferase
LYETLFYEKLRCKSPSTVAALLEVEAAHAGPPMKDLVTLDVGAGNGMVAEELRGRGVETLVGVDIIPEAAEAAHRDRPNLYEAYHVIDLIDPPAEIDRSLSRRGFNCLVTVAALGFGDIPPAAFARAYNYVADRGLIAFNIRDKFLSGEDDSGFSRLIRRSIESKILDIAQQNRYCHRYSTRGERLHYIAMVGRKRADIPKEWFDDMQ